MIMVFLVLVVLGYFGSPMKIYIQFNVIIVGCDFPMKLTIFFWKELKNKYVCVITTSFHIFDRSH